MAFQVPTEEKRKFPWWIVIVAAVVLLLGGAALIWALTRPDDPAMSQSPTPTPTPTPEVLASESLDVPVGNTMVDFEKPEVWPNLNCKFLPGSDLCFFDDDVYSNGVPGLLPLNINSTTSAGVAVVANGDYDTCVEATSDPEVTTYASVPDLPFAVYVCFVTGARHFGVLEIAPQVAGEAERTIVYTIWERQA
ncbi:hypothetical protein ACPW96_19150 [Micromonospora sp. DT81.3]|uniref:hypothetical protein n=1 Tax=Micromonospora sp. DT81.3 TaxID=3416523 RepID=UPI003CF33A58